MDPEDGRAPRPPRGVALAATLTQTEAMNYGAERLIVLLPVLFLVWFLLTVAEQTGCARGRAATCERATPRGGIAAGLCGATRLPNLEERTHESGRPRAARACGRGYREEGLVAYPARTREGVAREPAYGASSAPVVSVRDVARVGS